MVSFTVTTTFRPEDRRRVEDAIMALTYASRQEPGCQVYIPHWAQGEPATLVIYEQYADQAALDTHRETPHFLEYSAVLEEYTHVISHDYRWLSSIL